MGFKNKYYQAPGYLGSRVLEWDQIPPCREEFREEYDPACCEVYPIKECCCEPYTEFNWTQSIAVDGQGYVYVLDNVNRIRVLHVPEGETTSADVYTLVDGACRAIRDFTMLETVIVRVVGCHHEWFAKDTP